MKKLFSIICVAIVVLNVKAQVPNISIAQPSYSLIINQAITPIAIENKGGPIPAFNYGLTSTFVGSGAAGFVDGGSAVARFDYPIGVTLDALGNLYVADFYNNRIRKITPLGEVGTFAGSTPGYANGAVALAKFKNPIDLAFDASGNLYIADFTDHRIRKITTAGVVSNLAGDGAPSFADGTGSAAKFSYPRSVAVDGSGNVYVVDSKNHRIRKITPAGVVSVFAGGAAGFADGAAAVAKFNEPRGVAIDASDNLYVVDSDNQRIRKITPAGVVSTLAGNGTRGFADGPGTVAKFNNPRGIVVHSSGNVYVADFDGHRIRKITPAGVVSTLSGSGTSGFADGAANVAKFSNPNSVVAGASGNVYVTDSNNQLIRSVKYVGYAISPTLPEGLSLDVNTGKILGTPTTLMPATVYTVTAYNKFGDSNVVLVSLEVVSTATLPQLKATSVQTNVGAFGGSDGAITLTPSGGTGTYTYLWSNAKTTKDLTGLVAGTYSCTITSGVQSTVVTVEITEPAKIDPTPTPDREKLKPNNNITQENPIWLVEGIEKYPDNKVMIYDRYGRILKVVEDYNNDNNNWDGIIDGKKLDQGTYYFVIDLKGKGKDVVGFVSVFID
ncbi:MAG: T9SS type B sorting domain-containing protein [Sphingobacteriaceae bacterium]|nr:T9SS type B sorting domain-containing protein [Sphingobacteriaceae bacterium]